MTSQTQPAIDLNALAAAIENTKRAGQFFAQPVDQTHLDNLLARETARQATIITISKCDYGWTATFKGSTTMPNGIELSLPFGHQAAAAMVRADLRSRFAGATLITKANSR